MSTCAKAIWDACNTGSERERGGGHASDNVCGIDQDFSIPQCSVSEADEVLFRALRQVKVKFEFVISREREREKERRRRRRASHWRERPARAERRTGELATRGREQRERKVGDVPSERKLAVQTCCHDKRGSAVVVSLANAAASRSAHRRLYLSASVFAELRDRDDDARRCR